jgi:hypothetical protein
MRPVRYALAGLVVFVACWLIFAWFILERR